VTLAILLNTLAGRPARALAAYGGRQAQDLTALRFRQLCETYPRAGYREGGRLVGGVRPRLMGVLETVLYYRTEQEEAVEHFYRDVLGLRPLGRWGWMMAFRAGGDVYLMCNADQYAERTETPLHGASGPVHTAFLAPADEYERWKGHLAEQGVPLIEEITRDTGRSVYFRDPAGNLLEIMDADPWPS
jgi:catechol 2,3-dioxygenase-like lactoylglutathione lyase family enzyme